MAVGKLFSLPFNIAAGFACTSLLTDAASSAVKRRMHVEPGTEFVGLDQVGESLLPLVLYARPLSIDVVEIMIVVATFTVLDLLTARMRQRQWLR